MVKFEHLDLPLSPLQGLTNGPLSLEIVEGSTYNITLRVFYLQGGAETFRDFVASKVILENASPYIASILSQPTYPEILEVRGLTPNVLERILEFLHSYTYTIEVRGLKLEILAGLLIAADCFHIPSLSRFCLNIVQVGMDCDAVLSLFRRLTSENYRSVSGGEYPPTYYCELLKLCYKYILENAENILAADGFSELPFKNVEAIIQSDFLGAGEWVVFRAVTKWATCQCRREGLPPSIENLRRVLRRPGDRQGSLGILDKIRFPLMCSKASELQLMVGGTPVTKEIIESAFANFSSGESSGSFSSKERLRADSNRLVDFKADLEKHAEGFAKGNFGSMSYPTIQRMEDQPHRPDHLTRSQDLSNDESESNSSGFSSSENAQEIAPSLNSEIDNGSGAGARSLSNSMNEFLNGIDVEGNFDAVNICQKKVQPLKEFVKHFDSLTTMPDNSRRDLPSGFIKHCIEKSLANVDEEKAQEWESDLRLFVSNYLFPSCHNNTEANISLLTSESHTEVDETMLEGDSCSERAEFNACPFIPLGTPESESEMDTTANEDPDPTITTLTQGFSEGEGEDIPCLAGSAFFRSQESTLLDHRKTATTRCKPALSRSQQQFTSSSFGTIPGPARSMTNSLADDRRPSTSQTMTVSSTPTSVEHEHLEDFKIELKNDDFTEETASGIRITNLKMRYSDVIAKCIENPRVTKVDLNDMITDDFTKSLKPSFPSVCLPNLKEFQVVATVSGIAAEPKCRLPLENYIFFYGKNKSPEKRLSELWSNSVRTKLMLNGVTVFSAAPITGKLALNHPKDSTFVQLKSQELSSLSSLSIANCVVKRTCWLEEQSSNRLKSLRLYFYTIERILNKSIDPLKLNTFMSLKHLVLWPNENQTPVFSLNHLPADLETLAVCSHLIKYEESDITKVVFPHVTKIIFKDCSWDPDFVEQIADLFPKLRFIFVTGRFNQPGPDLVETLLKMKTVEEVLIGNLDLKLLKKARFSQLKIVLSTVDISKYSNECHLKLTREAGPRAPWESANISKKSDFPRLIYDAFSFDTIYTFQSWKYYVWETLLE